MTLRHALLTAAAVLAVTTLAACKKEGVVAKDESAESVARKVAASDLKPQPGRWEANMKLEKLDLPGMPGATEKMQGSQAGVTQTFASCLTPEQVNQPGAGFFQKHAANCKYDHFVMAGGKLDAALTCGEAGHVSKVTMAGDYTPTHYAVRVSSQGEMQPGRAMTMEMSIAATRVGECNGSEEK